MPLLLYFSTSGAFLFGYAKPVPVNFGNLRHPKRDMIWVALAGPASNFIQALGWAVVLVIVGGGWACKSAFSWKWPAQGCLVNLVMWAFNLFPLPPLDGGRILVGLLPYQASHRGLAHGALWFFHRAGPGVARAWWAPTGCAR